MITHSSIWAAIDGIAERYKLSPSGLAREAGLDATTFNKSKRFTANGRERWPSTESIAKVLEATGAGFDEFVNLMVAAHPGEELFSRTIPLIDMDLAGADGFLDKSGYPQLAALSQEAVWDEINFPEVRDEHMFGLEVVCDDYEPVYWAGDMLVISPLAETRRGDRVMIKYVTGSKLEVAHLIRRSSKRVELATIQNHETARVVDMDDIEWISRIVWVKQ